ncbi:MAG: DNA methyltransferase [Vampirovibrionales bacterium]
MLNSQSFRTPKQTPSSKLQKTLRYYAAYSVEFVEDVIQSLGLQTGHIILDPWNGSGTSTCVAALQGIECIGFDLNPAIHMYAKARLATQEQKTRVQTRVSNLLTTSSSCIESSFSLDLLTYWFHEESLVFLKQLKHRIEQESNPYEQALLNVAVVASLKKQLTIFRSKNPTWIKKAKQATERLHFNQALFIQDLQTTLELLPCTHSPVRSSVHLATASSNRLPLANESVDAIITSPPYCTRIDYAIATLVELAWMNLTQQELDHLRLQLIGSPKVGSSSLQLLAPLPPSVQQLLDTIQAHPSKASAGYYYRTFFNFFHALQASFQELHRVLRPDGQLCLVVQDSFYKNLHIDLPSLCHDMLLLAGFELTSRQPYTAGGLNFIHGHRKNTEVALTWRKIHTA